MTEDPADAHVRRLAAEALAADDATGWFERLYLEAERGEAVVPWDRGVPQKVLVEWTDANGVRGEGRRALVVGCGLGSDAEHIAGLEFATAAFDISEAAVRAARRRFPDSAVAYQRADLLDPPAAWRQAYDLVVESLTVQSIPVRLRQQAIANVAEFVAPGGALLVIAAIRDDASGLVHGPPWPLTRIEVEAFGFAGLDTVRVEQLAGPGPGAPRRWRAEFHRPSQ